MDEDDSGQKKRRTRTPRSCVNPKKISLLISITQCTMHKEERPCGGGLVLDNENERTNEMGGTGREEMNDRISRNATERSECEWCGTWLGVVRWGLCMHNVVICQLWFQCQWRGGAGGFVSSLLTLRICDFGIG